MRFNSIITTVILGMLMASVASAAIIRVNNNAGADADYTTLQDAQNAAGAGDTIYVEGSAAAYGNSTITERLYIVGPGYFLDENPETQANTQMASLSTTYFAAGSEGTVVTGCNFIRHCYVYTDSITLRGNRLWDSYNLYIGDGSNAISDVLISQCYIYSYSAIEVAANATNITIRNSHTGSVSGTATSEITFYNNVCWGTINVHNSVLNNNIMYSGTFYPSNNIYSYNLADGTQFGEVDGNQANVTMAAVFVATGSTDGYWQLTGGSQASGAGFEGVDCGMYGGGTPYVLSGLMDAPSIWFLSATGPGTATGGLNVRIKAKSH
ncbi:MAG: hypothetical protein V3W14_06460 [Candidatus Neomarinimicrobiota bacterium]